MARRHVTVALSGDGGDETFGGYDFRYLPHAAEGYARAIAGPWGRRALGGLGRRWPTRHTLPRALRIGTLLENVARDPAAAYYFDLCVLKPNAARALIGLSPLSDLSQAQPYAAATDPYRRCGSTSIVQRAMYADLKVYLPNDVLVKVDRMSMQHGLEVRCPLLDRRIVEFGFRAPTRFKMPRWRAKHLLKSLAATRLPPELLRLPKHGFSAPVGEWIGSSYADRFRADVLRPGAAVSTMLDKERVGRMFDDHVAGRANHAYPLWAIWMLERWHQTARRPEPQRLNRPPLPQPAAP
jgi:asparagine synthase (glutamine-hydrolysing)